MYCSRSRTAKRQGIASPSSEKDTEERNHKHLTLTAAFSFDNEKSPVASSRELEERVKQRSSLSSFRVEEPPLNGPIRDTHELVLSYIRTENPRPTYYDRSNKPQGYAETEKHEENSQTDNLLKSTSTASKYYLHDLDTSQISSTLTPERGRQRSLPEEPNVNTKPFRIVVPSTTPDYSLEEVTIRPKLSDRRRNHGQPSQIESTTTNYETVKPYKLPPLTRETIESLSVKQAQLQSQPTTERFKLPRSEDQNDYSSLLNRRKSVPESKNQENIPITKGSSAVTREETLKFIPVMPQRSSVKTSLQDVPSPDHNTHNGTRTVLHDFMKDHQENKKQNEEINVTAEQSSTPKNNYTSRFQDSRYYLKGISTTEESIFKLIPIKTVSSRLKSQVGSNEAILLDSNYYDTVTATRPMLKKENIYEVTEGNKDIKNIRPISGVSRRYQPQISQENLLRSKSNSSEFFKGLYEETAHTTTSNYGRIQSRPTQTTKSPSIQKQIYSLTINDEQVKQNNKDAGGILLATLETITNIPIPSDNNPKKHNSTLSTSEDLTLPQKNLNKKTTHRIVSQSLSQHQNGDYRERPSYTNQIRIRNQARPSTLTNGYLSRRMPTLDSTTERSEKEAVTSTRMRVNLKSRQREEQPVTKKAIEVNNNLKNTQETAKPEKEYFSTTTISSDIQKEWSTDSSSNINTKYNKQPLNDQRRRQFKQKDRLSTFPVNEDEVSDFIKQTAVFDSEEEENVYIKEETATDQKTQMDNRKRGPHESDSAFSPGADRPIAGTNAVESATLENDSDFNSDIVQERQPNVRKMHIRKTVRVTPVKSQSTTQSYEDTYDTYYSKSRKTTLDVEEQPSFTQFTANEAINNYENSKTNLITVTPGLTKQKTRGPLGYRSNHKENEHRPLESDYNQVEEKGTQDSQLLNSPTSPIDPYALLRSSRPKTSDLSSKNKSYEQVTLHTEKTILTRNKNVETMSPIAVEINSFFNEVPHSSTAPPPTVPNNKSTTTPFPSTTAERIKDKFRLGSFPKPAPPSNSYVRKPGVEDGTPPPLPSDRCSQELDNESECNEKPLLR